MLHSIKVREARKTVKRMKGGWENTYVSVTERRALIAEARAKRPDLAGFAATDVDYTAPGGVRVTFDDTRDKTWGFQ